MCKNKRRGWHYLIKVAVCEDQKIQRDSLIQNIYDYASANDEAILVHGYANAEIFLFHRADDGPFDCLFLDIDMGEGVSGMALAQKIRETDDRVAIVFVTALTDYVFSGYKVHALDYLIKPVKQNDLAAILAQVHGTAEDLRKNALFIKTSTDRMRIPFEEIFYAESHLHYIDIHTANGVQRIREGISNIEKLLPADKFARVHRSFIVNLTHVKTANRNDVTLRCDKSIPVGRKYWKEVDAHLLSCFGPQHSAPDDDKAAT
jgi:DNA-binding LytR/AlgR family response regulator